MLEPRGGKIRVYEYEFELHVTHCKIQARFPCTFCLVWRAGDKSIEDGRAISALTDTIPFNSTLRVNLDVAFDESSQVFLEKKTILFVNLNSNLTTQARNVGLINLDVSMCLNSNNMTELRVYPLEKCPDRNSSIMLSLKNKFVRELTAREVGSGSPSPNRVVDVAPKPKGIIDRAALRERFGLTGIRQPKNDNPLTHRITESAAQKLVTQFGADKQKKEEAVDSSRDDKNIIALENYEAKQLQEEPALKPTRGGKKIEVPLLSLIAERKAHTPTHRAANTDRVEHDLWITKIHENALQRKSQILESSLREQIVRLKGICQKLNMELSQQHIERVKLEGQLEHCRCQNLQLKQNQRNLQKELSSGKPIEQDNTIRLLRRNIERLQKENDLKQARINALQQDILNYTHSKLELASQVERVSHELDIERSTPKNIVAELNKEPLRRADTFRLPCFASNHTGTQTQSDFQPVTSVFQEVPVFFNHQPLRQKYHPDGSKSPKCELEKALKVIEQLQLRIEDEKRLNAEANIKLEDIDAELKITRHNDGLKESEFLKRIQTLQEQNTKLANEMDPIKTQLKAKNNQVQQFSLEIQYLEQKQQKNNLRILTLEKELSVNEIQISQFKKEIQKLRHEIMPQKQEEQNKIIQEFSCKVIALELNKRQHQNQIKKKQSEIIFLKDKIDQYQAELSKPKDKMTRSDPNLLMEVKRFKNQLHDSPAESDKSQAKKAKQLKKQLQQCLKNEENYKARNTLLEKYLKKYESEVNNNRKIIEQLTVKLHQPNEKQKQFSNQEKQNLEKQIKKLISEKQRLEDKQDGFQDNNKRLLIEKQRLQADNDQLKQQVEDLKSKIRNIQGKELQNQKLNCISELRDKLLQMENKYHQSSKLASKLHFQVQALNQTANRYKILQLRQDANPHELYDQNRELQQLLVSLTCRNQELIFKYESLSNPRTVSFREMSLELNKAKAKLLALGTNADLKKSMIIALRPLQQKIQGLVRDTQQIKASKNTDQQDSCEQDIDDKVPSEA